MKFLLLLLLPILGLSSQLTKEEEQKLKIRLELFGLTEDKKEINQLQLANEYQTEIIYALQSQISIQYVPKMQSYLGKCPEGDCMIEKNGYLALKTPKGEVCLPNTRCEFYKCMEEKYKCEPEGVDYFTKLAQPTCSNYLDNIKKKRFTQKGHDWIYSVMVCLQKGLIDECELKDNCRKYTKKETCNYITDFTLKFHPGCYLNSGIGVCNLPLSDQINIWRTVGKYLTSDEMRQAVATVKQCIIKERG